MFAQSAEKKQIFTGSCTGHGMFPVDKQRLSSTLGPEEIQQPSQVFIVDHCNVCTNTW